MVTFIFLPLLFSLASHSEQQADRQAVKQANVFQRTFKFTYSPSSCCFRMCSPWAMPQSYLECNAAVQPVVLEADQSECCESFACFTE